MLLIYTYLYMLNILYFTHTQYVWGNVHTLMCYTMYNVRSGKLLCPTWTMYHLFFLGVFRILSTGYILILILYFVLEFHTWVTVDKSGTIIVTDVIWISGALLFLWPLLTAFPFLFHFAYFGPFTLVPLY